MASTDALHGDSSTPRCQRCNRPRHDGRCPSYIAGVEAERDRLREAAERATDLAERYSEAIMKIAAALVAEDLNPNGRIMRARIIIVGLGLEALDA